MFKVYGDTLKPTFCTDALILDLVCSDYTVRQFDFQFEECGTDSFHLDFGGGILTTMKPFDLGKVSENLSNFSFFPHHLGAVQSTLAKSRDRGGYEKLHGAYSCLCVSLAEAEKIRALVAINSGAIEVAEEEQFAAWRALKR